MDLLNGFLAKNGSDFAPLALGRKVDLEVGVVPALFGDTRVQHDQHALPRFRVVVRRVDDVVDGCARLTLAVPATTIT